jgi:hypothetical protein
MFKKSRRTIGVLIVTFAVLTLLFQSTVTAADPPYPHIGDFVWEDLNKNGLQDEDEPGIEGAIVTLYTFEDVLLDSTTTDENGLYILGGPFVPPGGEYYIVFEAPPTGYDDYVFTLKDAGDNALDSDADSMGMTDNVILEAGFDLTFDAGLYQEISPPGSGVGTPGYWKNHPEAWPVDDITIGGVTYSKDDAIDFMEKPVKKDKTYNMFSQLIAAKLNVLIGNDDSCIAGTISAADAWMADNPVGSDVRAKSDAWVEGESLKDELDDYNNGLLCAPARD